MGSRIRSRRRVHPMLDKKKMRQTPVEDLPKIIMENIERERIEEEKRATSGRNEKTGTSEEARSYDGFDQAS